MEVNENAFILGKRVALETIASKLAPTKKPSGSRIGLFLALSGFRVYAGLGSVFLHA
jgi:hypothetical protein